MMRRALIHQVSLLILCIACVQDAGLGATETAVTPIENGLEVIPRETLPGLPVAVIVRQRNAGQVPHYVVGRLMVVLESLRITVADPKGEERRLSRGRWGHLPSSSRRGTPLAPLASRSTKEWVGWMQSGPFFPAPGTYSVFAEVREPLEVRSKEAPLGYEVLRTQETWTRLAAQQVVVRRPQGHEVEASRLFPSEGNALDYLLNDGVWVATGNTDEIVRRLEKLAWDYSDTDYGKYALYLLAARKEVVATTRPLYEPLSATEEADLRDAVDLLLRLESIGPPENLRLEVQINLAFYYAYLGDRPAAEARLKRLQGMDLPDPLRRSPRNVMHILSKRDPQEETQQD